METTDQTLSAITIQLAALHTRVADLESRLAFQSRPFLTEPMILDAVSNATGIAVHAMLRRGRGGEPISWARNVAMYLIRDLTGLGYQHISHLFSGRNQASSWIAEHKVLDRMSVDPAASAQVQKIKDQLCTHKTNEH